MAAPKKNKFAKGNDGGRPTLYKDEYAEQAYKFCLLGATDTELADFFNVDERTINNWKTEHEEFFQSVTRGKVQADAEIANSFYNRAKGFEIDSEKIFQSEGQIIRADTKTYFPPDAGAALNWLKNRQPKKWRDKTEVETTIKVGKDLDDEVYE